MVYGESISLATRGFSDIKNISGEVQEIVHNSGIKNGLVNICVIGSTASISTIEFEPALVEDVREKLEVLVSSSTHSRHSETWGDDNGFSHIRLRDMVHCQPLRNSGNNVSSGGIVVFEMLRTVQKVNKTHG